MFGGTPSASLRSGGALRCGELFVERVREGGAVERVELPRPSAGVGGVELVVAPNEQYAALFLYSGQSELGYELFALEPTLHHVGGLAYVAGEGLAPVFSPDSRWLALVCMSGFCVRGTGEYAEDVLGVAGGEAGGEASGEASGEGDVLVDWARVFFQRIPDGAIEQVAIGTRIPRSTDPDDFADWSLYDEPARFATASRLAIPLPWGDVVELELPAAGPVTTPSSPAGRA